MTALLEARLEAYDLLTHTFLQEPAAAFVAVLAQRDVAGFWPFRGVDPAIDAALGVVSVYLLGTGANHSRSDFSGWIARNHSGSDYRDTTPDEICDTLRRDYTRLFVGPGRPLAPPWESIYTDAERLHFAEDTLRVRAAYRQHGWQVTNLGREPDDHLGFELDFVRRLCATAIERADEGQWSDLSAILEDQRAFLDGHLLRWVPAWAFDVSAHAQTGFYRGMAALLAAFLPYDRERLCHLIASAHDRTSSA